jgi:hypothetical protein
VAERPERELHPCDARELLALGRLGALRGGGTGKRKLLHDGSRWPTNSVTLTAGGAVAVRADLA